LADLAGGSERTGRGRALQRALLEAVEALKPARDGNPGPKALRRYRLLKRRYVDGLSPEAVQRELLIGRSEYYREHEQAVSAVASLLGELLGGVGPPPDRGFPAWAPSEPAGGVAAQLRIPATSFVGREDHLAELIRLLGTTRLLTLTGAGGCGKTRLALHAASDLRAVFPAGVHVVELAPLADAELVEGAVAAVLGLRDAPGQPMLDRLLRFVGDKRLLLVLDNCEHVVDACAHLADALLRGTSSARLLATSRELLRVGGEVSWRVPPLTAPPFSSGGAPSPAEIQDYPAVRLFTDRAAAVVPGFRLTRENAPAVARICQRLDGMPLALELAAARVRVLTADEIAERLDSRFRLLTGGDRTALRRHQTLRALVDWSFELLSDQERALFRRLAVFAGGWTLAAAEAVCGHDAVEAEAVLDLLTGLVDKSVAVADGRGAEERYRFPETIREYALERLAESGEAEAVRQRHAVHFAALAEEAAAALTGPLASSWLDKLVLEQDNLRAALRWCEVPEEAELGLRCAAALWRFWLFRGDRAEGLTWLTRLLAVPSGAARRVRAGALRVAATLAATREEYGAADAWAEEGLAIGRELGDLATQADALATLAFSARRRGDFEGARALSEAALPLHRRMGQRWEAAAALLWLGEAALNRRQLSVARGLVEESLALYRELGDDWGIGAAHEHLGWAALDADEPDTAADLFGRSLEAYRHLGDRGGIANAQLGLGSAAVRRGAAAAARACFARSLPAHLELGEASMCVASFRELAYAAVVAGSPRRAQTLLGAAEAVSDRIGLSPSPVSRAWLDRWLPLATHGLDEAARTAARAAGRAMTLEEGVAYALGEADAGG
jgi:non-specific serine/threonine protein kinase